MILQILSVAALVQFVVFLVVATLKKRKHTSLHNKTVYRLHVEGAVNNHQPLAAKEILNTQPLPVEAKEAVKLL